MDNKTDTITTELKDITGILDDIADLFNDALGAINNSPLAQTPNSPMESILNGLISSMINRPTHGETTQDRPIQEILPTQVEETENESN